MVELAIRSRRAIQPLFHRYSYLSTIVQAVLHHGFGRAWADDPVTPTAACVQLDFNCFAGDLHHPASVVMLDRVKHAIVPDAAWLDLLRKTWGGEPRIHRRIAFRDDAFDTAALQRNIERLPAGYMLKRVEPADIVDFQMVASELICNFPSREQFVRDGIGFGVVHAGHFVAGCSSFAAAGNDVEIEIDTAPAHRRRGLATIAASAFILHCVRSGLTPHWDAHNEPSAALARKLGFCDELPYDVYHRRA